MYLVHFHHLKTGIHMKKKKKLKNGAPKELCMKNEVQNEVKNI